MSENKIHIDIIGVIAGNQIFLGHGDLSHEPMNPKRFQELSTLLMKLAWEFEDEAKTFENFKPRCFRNSHGDLFFEVAPNTFVDADNRTEAALLFANNAISITEDQLRTHYPEVEEVTE